MLVETKVTDKEGNTVLETKADMELLVKEYANVIAVVMPMISEIAEKVQTAIVQAAAPIDPQ